MYVVFPCMWYYIVGNQRYEANISFYAKRNNQEARIFFLYLYEYFQHN